GCGCLICITYMWLVLLKIRKIKIVFTPTICKQTCRSGHCYNSCEKGDTTTLYSQGGQNHDPKSGFRIYFCQIPCLNGGRCVGRDECWCPSNSTGKFCHLPVPKLEKNQVGRVPKTLASGSIKQSMYTLPLSNQLASLNPSLVNVHIKHPPEATVQIHQVARVRGDLGQSEENSVEAVLLSQLPTGPQHSYSNGNSNSITTESGQQQRPPELMGRCFRETLHGQCANPLEGLAKFEDCCGSVGLFWGVNRCIPCPPRPGKQVECPQGYKRLNRSHCQDINECLMLGLCKDTECVNTRGSFLCTCKPGTMLDPSRSRCVSDKAVSMEQGLCYRSAAEGVCALPLAQSITKQICCCSRVGKGWGRNCEKCPMLGSGESCARCPAVPSVLSLEPGLHLTPSPDSLAQNQHRLLATYAGLQAGAWHPRRLLCSRSLGIVRCWDVEVGRLWAGFRLTLAPVSDCDPKLVLTSLSSAGDVVEETFPHPPSQPGPEAAGECTAAAQITEMDRCASVPDPCGPGTCVNLPDRYSCICGPGYQLHPGLPRCIDLNECEQPSMCQGGQCTNTPGSYHCECARGYIMAGGLFADIDECADPSTCPRGRCVNALGSYECLSCAAGYQPMNGRCVGKEARAVPPQDPSPPCGNSLLRGSNSSPGQALLGLYCATQALWADDDECFTVGICAHGLCINLAGSFRCSCYHGYEVTADEKSCQDIDECSSPTACPLGICTNTDGSFACRACDAGYMLSSNRFTCEGKSPRLLSASAGSCVCKSGSNKCVCSVRLGSQWSCSRFGSHLRLGHDIDECEDPTVSCLGGECLNTPGSYVCHCRPGFELLNGTVCEDMNECLASEICSPNGECLNSHGSYFCICAPGFSNAAGGVSCQDVNECELMVAVCGTALCENVEGSFLCLCLSDHEEYNTEAGECRPRAGMGEISLGQELERKECYYHISDVQLCDSVLAKNTTKEECCCTEGAAWGDNCETHPCPILGTVEYSEICPSGKGYIPVEGTLLFGQTSYTDADECEMFGPEICRNGHCVNTVPGYKCFCRSGYLYDSSRLECVGEMALPLWMAPPSLCLGICSSLQEAGPFCPYVGMSQWHSLFISLTEDPEEHEIHLDICWQRVSNYICNQPLRGRRTTYTECCCRYGEAWSQDCALCPHRASGENAQSQGMNSPVAPRGVPSGSELRCAVCSLQADGPSVSTGHFDSFEGLQAEECGILNGCENGRCVRVREGYTCDCFDGFQLDMTHMACVDINECEEVSSSGPLCEGGTCENTEGSYRCNCSPGFVMQAEPHRCAPAPAQRPEAAS
uniref:Latent transforming growth factor beta binding protein 2 n=1 Tax=Gopherus evgoodei TaxID=1825980 RepID=A0A8C4VS97_9SAUR